MRKLIVLTTLALLIPLVAACPRQRQFRFTSADLQQGWGRFDNLVDTLGGLPAVPEGEPALDREVVEPDVIRQDGSLLYVLNQYRGLTLVDLDTNAIVSQVPTLGYPRDLYIDGNRAYVLVAYATDFDVDDDTIHYDIGSRVYVIDTADPANASVVSQFELDGDFVDSRLVGSVLYAVTADYQWYWVEGKIAKAQTSATRIVSINIADEQNIFQAGEVSLDGIGNVVQATSSAIFVAGYGDTFESSTITYVDIADPAGDIVVRGAVDVPGTVTDRFKMDAYNGVLRVVSTAWDDLRHTYVTTINLANPDALTVLGQTEFERARGEALFATRFDGPRAYVVTYLVVDPLFVVDLSDPANPAVVGELEVPGWSTHIEPRGNTLIALGVDDTDGRNVCVSLFDVTNPAAPALTDRVTFGDSWNWSSAYDDVKALTVLDDVLIVPFSGWEETGGGFDRLQFVSWSPADLVTRGSVDVQGTVLRSFEHGGKYYGVTTEQIATIDAADLDAPDVTQTLALAENVRDFVELSASLGAEIITKYDTGETMVRLVGLPLKTAIGEIAVEIGEIAAAHAYGNNVVLIGTTWTAEPSYAVAIVNAENPSDPQLDGILSIDVQPYYGYWWIWPYAGVAVDSLIAPWFPTHAQNTTLLAGDTLVLRCVAPSYDDVIGDDTPYEGLALVDLESLTWTSTVGLGFESVTSVDARDSRIYISTKTFVDTIAPQAQCAYFVTEFDPATQAAGPIVNVPGAFVDYDATLDLLILRDDQWNLNFTYASTLRTLSWDGGETVTPIDEEALPDGTSLVLGRDRRVFVESYDNGVWLRSAAVNDTGAIGDSSATLVTDQWASLLDARGTSAYLTVGNSAIARYDCSGPSPTLAEFVESMGAPSHIQFGNDSAYAPLGYAGIAELEL